MLNMLKSISMLIKYFKELLKDKKLMKACLTLAIPIMLQNLVGSSVNLVDNLMVGNLGDAAISAVASANKYYNVIMFAVNAMVASCIIFLAQYNGADNQEKMKESFRFAIVSSFVLLIVSFAIVILFPNQLIKFIIDDPIIIELGSRYIRIAAFSYLPLMLIFPIAGSLRAIGNSKTPLYLSTISVLTNCILDYALIFGKFGLPTMGVEGAALATVIARVVEASLYVIALKRNDYPFESRFRDIFKYSKELAKDIIIKAIPLVINEILFQFGMTMLFKAYSSRGATINAAYSVAVTVSDIFFTLFGGMAISTTVLVGTPLGANKLDEARSNGYKLLVFAVLLSILFGSGLFLSQFIVPLVYTELSSETIETSQVFLRCMGLLFWIYMFNCQCYFTLRAGGDTKATMLMDGGFMWCVNIPFVFFLAYKTTIPVVIVYILGQMTDFIKSLIAFGMVKKEKWVKNLAIENK